MAVIPIPSLKALCYLSATVFFSILRMSPQPETEGFTKQWWKKYGKIFNDVHCFPSVFV
jgi:hypothetical protein